MCIYLIYLMSIISLIFFTLIYLYVGFVSN